jgi:Fe-S-cluster-containing hydrogenase component 2
MANKPQDEKTVEVKPQRVSRREMIVGAGVGVAGLVAGGAVAAVIPRRKAPSPPVPDTWIGRNIAECTGCRLCQVVCSQIKEQKIQPAIARITVWQYYPGVEFPVACYQCGDEAKCVEACPTEALAVDTSKKLNTISIDTSLCLRTAKNGDCVLCQSECPGTAVTFHPTTREPLICDLCGGAPECIKACPSATISTKGVRMAAVDPAEIALGLAMAYNYPDPALMPQRPAAPPPAPRAAPASAGRGRGEVYVPPDR